MTPDEEQERLIAVLQGSFLAKNFPTVWMKQRNAQKQGLGTTAEQLLEMLKKRKNRNV